MGYNRNSQLSIVGSASIGRDEVGIFLKNIPKFLRTFSRAAEARLAFWKVSRYKIVSFTNETFSVIVFLCLRVHFPVSFCRTLYVYNLVNRCNAIPAAVETASHNRGMWLHLALPIGAVSDFWWSSSWSNAEPPMGMGTHYDTWDRQSTTNAFQGSRGVISFSDFLGSYYHTFLEKSNA